MGLTHAPQTSDADDDAATGPIKSQISSTISPTRHQRLVAQFQPATGSPPRLATVTGFAGSGKTEALRALGRQFQHRSAYLALEKPDRLPAQLIHRLRSTIAASQVPRSGGWILIDDFHVIDRSSSVDAMRKLLRRIPPGVSVAIASRTVPDLRWTDHGASGDLIEIDERHLAFSCADLVPLVDLQVGRSEALELAARLCRLTGGWPAVADVLRQQAPGRLPDIVAVSAERRPWTSVIEEEIIPSLQPLTRTALPALAETNGLTVAELEELVGMDRATTIISDLERTRSIDRNAAAADVIRLHPLLVDYARRHHTGERVPDGQRLLDWYRRTDRPLEAALLATTTGLSEHLVDALVNDWPRIADHVDDGAIQDLLDRSGLHSPRLPRPADQGLLAIQRHRTRLFTLAPRPAATEQPAKPQSEPADLSDAVLAVANAEVGLATEIRTRLGSAQSDSQSKSLPELSRAHYAAIPLWGCELPVAERDLLSLSSSLESPSPLASISIYGHLAVVYLEQERRTQARRAAEIARREAEISGLVQHPESCLATLVIGTLDDDRTLLEEATIASSSAGAVRRAYCGLVFIDSEASADSALIELVRQRVFGLMETMVDPGPLIADRLSRVSPLHRRRRYGIGLLIEPLTQREMDQLRYLPSDLNQRSIALRMGVSRNTVKTNNRAIYRKLGVSSRQEAVSTARQLGLL